MPQLEEVEITEHHRPTEWVKAGVWLFISIVTVAVLCDLFIQKPHNLLDGWSDVMQAFVIATTIVVLIVVGTTVVILLSKYFKPKVIDVGQFGTVVIKGRKTIELAPVLPDMPHDAPVRPTVDLISPSEKASPYLSYVKVADMLKAKGVDLQSLEDCLDEQDDPDPAQEFEQPIPTTIELTDLQKKVLNMWEQGKRGRLSIHKADPTISEHIAARTLAELKGAGLIK